MKKVLSLVLCVAVMLSFSAPISARVLNPKDEAAASSQSSPAKKDTVKDGLLVKKEPTPNEYIASVDAIRMHIAMENIYFNAAVYSPTTSEADLTREMKSYISFLATSIHDLAELRAPMEFSKTAAMYKAAAKKAVTWRKLYMQAINTNKDSDLEKAFAASESLNKSLEAANKEYSKACAKLRFSA